MLPKAIGVFAAASLAFILLIVIFWPQRTVFVSALCNDGYTDITTFDTSDLTPAERNVMTQRVETKLCVGHDGVFKKRPTETY